MSRFRNANEITPKEFELQVKTWIESTGSTLETFSAAHREKISGTDGEYEIDIVVRFTAFAGASFLMLVECKKHANPIKRELVQALHQKQVSLGAHKSMLVSTADFQSGAKKFAQSHGIALVRLISGIAMYVQGSKTDGPLPRPIPEEVDPFAGIFYAPDSSLVPQPFNSHTNYGFLEFITGAPHVPG